MAVHAGENIEKIVFAIHHTQCFALIIPDFGSRTNGESGGPGAMQGMRHFCADYIRAPFRVEGYQVGTP